MNRIKFRSLRTWVIPILMHVTLKVFVRISLLQIFRGDSQLNKMEKFANPGYLKALWRNGELNHMRALVAGDTSDDLKRY